MQPGLEQAGPGPISVTQTQIDWALEYDGYRRLAGTPEKLERLLRGARNSYQKHGVVPDWCGVDLLRGWAFYLTRGDRHSGGGTLGEEWRAVLAMLTEHPHAGPADRPPEQGPATAVGESDPGFPLVFSAEPRMHRDPTFLEDKRARLREPHVAAINDLVDRVASQTAMSVPYVDPDSGGIKARVLFVLESPATPAALGSGMLSADNDDETAKNIWHSYRESGMPRTYGLHWNAVPWYVGAGGKNGRVTNADVAGGRTYLRQLLCVTPDIRVIVAFGSKARISVDGLIQELAERDIVVLHSIHPSPRNYNSRRQRTIHEVRAAFAGALVIADRTQED